jgi:phosphate uptake regulator
MDVRKIQVTGGSSYMVTLPKEWAEKVGLKKNAPVGLQPQPDGSLIIYPADADSIQAHSLKTIDATYVDDLVLFYRRLIGAYIAGHTTIEIRSDTELDTQVANVTSNFVQNAIGLEILEEDETHITIKDLINQDELRPIKSVERMKILVRNMLNDVLNALDKKDPKYLADMDNRDREVDRLNWLIARQVNIHQKDITISRRQGADLITITRCGIISKTIERIGDHAIVLSNNLRSLIDDDSTNLVDEEIVATGRAVVTLFSDSVATWVAKDMDSANDCLARGENLVQKSISISKMSENLSGKGALAARIISESVKRVAEYSMDISEMTINAAME